jgi:hypothetical protein
MKTNLRPYFVSAALLAATVARARGPLGYDIANDQPRWGEGTTVPSYTHPEASDYDFPAPKPGDVRSEYSAGGASGEPEAGETSSQESRRNVTMIAPDPSGSFVQQIWTSP